MGITRYDKFDYKSLELKIVLNAYMQDIEIQTLTEMIILLNTCTDDTSSTGTFSFPSVR
jgi:hypothetical protein